MDSFSKQVEIRWSDLDPNFHLRHSVYYDFAVVVRMAFLGSVGITTAMFQEQHFGPILFREECVFKREIQMGDTILIKASLLKARKDFSRWTIVHEFWKTGDTLAAVLTVDGAWMDTLKRKLHLPSEDIQQKFSKVPRHLDFAFEGEISQL